MRPANLLSVFYTVGAALLSIELIGWLGIVTGLLGGPAFPTYRISPSQWMNYHADIDPVFGTWRQPALHTRDVRPCFNVSMTSNNYGARDADWQLPAAEPGIILLGDSYLEGQGVAIEQTLATQLEAATGKEVYNMATAGHFGPTQYRLIYETYRDRIPDATVLVGINLPNDLSDEDSTQASFGKRYRPYLEGSYPDYALSYAGKTIEESSYCRRKSSKAMIKVALQEYSFSYRLYLAAQSIVQCIASPNHSVVAQHATVTPDPALLDRLIYNLEEINRLADGRLVVFTVPTKTYATNGHSSAELDPLYSTVERRLASSGIRLLRTEDTTAFTAADFHTCDPHWNAAGHTKVSQLIAKQLGTPQRSNLAK